MGGERVTIYVGDPVRRVLAQTGQDNRSGRINDVCARYDAIIDDELHRLKLTEGEWCAIVDANNGTFMHDEIGWRHAWANVWDHDEELGPKWHIDQEALTRKLRALSLAGHAAVAEVIERFWDASSERRYAPGATYADLLRAAGARIPKEEEASNA